MQKKSENTNESKNSPLSSLLSHMEGRLNCLPHKKALCLKKIYMALFNYDLDYRLAGGFNLSLGFFYKRSITKICNEKYSLSERCKLAIAGFNSKAYLRNEIAQLLKEKENKEKKIIELRPELIHVRPNLKLKDSRHSAIHK